MEESREPSSSENENNSEESGTGNQADATSKETLSDIETGESAEATESEGGAEKTSTPSPDGQFDEGSERDKARPM